MAKSPCPRSGHIGAVIAGSVHYQGKIVAADEREAGQALLIWAIRLAMRWKAASNYRYSHGEAVAIGLVGSRFIGLPARSLVCCRP